MKLWRHDSDGHWLGCAGIIAAETRKEAEQITRAALDECGLKGDKVNLHEIPLSTGVIYFDSGDY